jgi:hypothetical protein
LKTNFSSVAKTDTVTKSKTFYCRFTIRTCPPTPQLSVTVQITNAQDNSGDFAKKKLPPTGSMKKSICQPLLCLDLLSFPAPGRDARSIKEKGQTSKKACGVTH